MRKIVYGLAASLILLAGCNQADGEHRICIVATNDVHGQYFDSLYTGGNERLSLANVSSFVNGLRQDRGDDNVILIDVGDFLQGDNAAYYYNYEDTVTDHLGIRMAEYMGYDAMVVGNHDIETGHPVYDRFRRDLDAPYLGANAVRESDGKAYFDEYTILKRDGVKIAVIGFTNPNIKGWLPEELWSGMEFDSILASAQELVDKVREKERPHLVVVAMHSGTGTGKAGAIENEGLAALNSLKGVDFVFCAHDHSSKVIRHIEKVDGRDSLTSVLLNGGSHCREVSFAEAELVIEDGKVVSKVLGGELVPMNGVAKDTAFLSTFRPDFEAVRKFTLQEVGRLEDDIVTNEAFMGRSFYTDLLHTIQLYYGDADVSFAAPLTYNQTIEEGVINFQSLFTIYPFENQLFVIKMTGKEIKDALEYSYSKWVNRLGDDKYVLAIRKGSDKRTGSVGYSFKNRTYNFDSAAGLVYEVDLKEESGNMVKISSLADGRKFDLDSTYNVAMTSYRASGGGGNLQAAGVNTADLDDRIVARYPELRRVLYDYVREQKIISEESVMSNKSLGDWKFVPKRAEKKIKKEHDLIFED